MLTPRGKYEMRMYPSMMVLHGKTYEFRINYSNIIRLFVLPQPGETHFYFVIEVDVPVKQNLQKHRYLVFQFLAHEDIEVEIAKEVRIRVLRSSIAQVISKTEPAEG